MNDELYNMMLSLCPAEWKFIKVRGASADGFLDYVFNTKFDTKWVLNLDEDCFLINYESIYKLIDFMENNDYDYCGIQDGGEIPVRIHHPLVSNPFFNLFNMEKIYSLDKNYYYKKYAPDEIAKKYSNLIRFNNGKLKYDFYEEFYKHFFWLLESGMKPYFIEAKEFRQERYFVIAPLFRTIPYYNCPTLLLDNDGIETAIHTWHSRYYHYPNIKNAINNCYRYAREKSMIFKKDVTVIKL
jgi:hypothetical protein